MNPEQLNLPTIWRGCYWELITFRWLDINGNPFNLNGWSPRAMLRSGQSLNASVTDPVNGVTTIGMGPVQTALCNLGVEQWDWLWTQDGSHTYAPLLSGTVSVQEPETIPPAP